MAISQVEEKRLDELYAMHKPKLGGRREDYFALQFLAKKFRVEAEQIGHQVAFGGNDYGLDAYFIDPIARNLYLYQFKWSPNHALFKESMERLADHGLARLFGASPIDPTQNTLLTYLRKDLNEYKQVIDRVYVHFVFKGDVEEAERSESLATRREDLENKAHLINQFFGREVEYQIDYLADKPGRSGPPPSQKYVVSFSSPLRVEHDNKTMWVGLVPLIDLQNIHRSLGGKFFDRNIRAALSDGNAPNRKLRDAFGRIVLKEQDQPSLFVFRHNGVTLAAERVDVGTESVTLHVPRLLNGAQTVSSLSRFLDENADNKQLAANRDRLNQIRVLAKIVQDDPSGEFVTQVTISNNQQNPVPPWALRAMDRRQVDLAEKFKNDPGIPYERQEGAFDGLSEDDLEEMGFEATRPMKIRQMAQTLLAIQGDIVNMRQLPQVFESQKAYEAAFADRFITSGNPRGIVLIYKTGLMLRKITSTLEERIAARHLGAIPMAKNLAWALMAQALLNDEKYATLRDDYGGSLTKEAAFGETLVKLSGARISPILKHLIGTPAYESKVANGKYDFLRTNEAYKRGMQFAADQFDWQKKSV